MMQFVLDHIDLFVIGFFAFIIILVVWGMIMQRKGLTTADDAIKEGREQQRDAVEVAERSLELCEQSVKLQEETNKLLREISAKLSTHS